MRIGTVPFDRIVWDLAMLNRLEKDVTNNRQIYCRFTFHIACLALEVFAKLLPLISSARI